jgi:hypothetical protein
VITTLFASCNKSIVGKWKVTDMQIDMEYVPQIVIDNAKTIALSTSYDFSADGRFTMTILPNDVSEYGRKYTGTKTFKNNQLILETDTMLFFNNAGEILNILERNNAMLSNKEKTMKMKIEKITSNQVILSEEENSGTLYYLLNKIKKSGVSKTKIRLKEISNQGFSLDDLQIEEEL